MQRQAAPSGKHYYAHSGWDEAAWIEIIAVEYESLVAAYPFDQALRSPSRTGPLRLLDIGCGTAIFPRFLDPTLSPGLSIEVDLLDISAASLRRAAEVYGALEHFTVGESFTLAIEGIPSKLVPARGQYDLLWAIHSFTTVDQARMPEVFQHLRKLLAPGGLFFIYQLTAQSSYQALHGFYRERVAEPPDAYMQFEESAAILRDMGWPYDIYELRFPHRVPGGDEAALSGYLRKVMLDDGLDPLDFFAPILNDYRVGEDYHFPQSVNLIVLRGAG